MSLQLVGSLLVIGVMIGLTGAFIVHIMRRVEWELNQSMFAAFDARRLLEVEEDRDTMILTRTRIEPLIEVANVRFDRTMLWLHLADGRVIGAPLVRWERLQRARRRQRRRWRLVGDSSLVVWDDLNVRISARVLMGHEP